MKLSMARASSQGAWITSKAHGKTELKVNRLTATLCSNLRARLQQDTAGYKCNQGHGWIAHNHMYKTSLLKYLKICMDLSVASSLHGIKITAEQGLKQQHHYAQCACLCQSPQRSQKYMAYTPVKMAWHSSKHMQTSTSQDAHINHGKNDKRARFDNRQQKTL